jgi:hypothetical protein
MDRGVRTREGAVGARGGARWDTIEAAMHDHRSEDYGARTVNERLFAAGRMADFERAVAAGDVQSVEAMPSQQPSVRGAMVHLWMRYCTARSAARTRTTFGS